MLFPSTIFIFVFAPIAIIGYWLVPGDRLRKIWLTVVSYIFYGYWNWWFCSLLLVITIVDYLVALRIFKAETLKARKFWLIVSLVSNLGLLGFFKYFMLLAGTVNHVSGFFHGPDLLPGWHIILPIGISFFTFQSMSYTIDVYRREFKPTNDLFEFAAYVSLFPQLIAGPIVRYMWIRDTLLKLPEKITNGNLNLGFFFFTFGLVKKVLIADRISYFIDPMFADYHNLTSVETWLSMIGYSLQIYFDFSGYSLMAIGLGFLLGFKFPRNFDSPYKAVSMSDFWRRWHLTLSSWLRDYLYIPLGGRNNRFIALFVTMFLGGLWHGPNWTFVIWGLYHAAGLQLHHWLKNVPWYPRNSWFARIGTFLSVTIAWVFFRPNDFSVSLVYLQKMFDIPGLLQAPKHAQWGLVTLIVAGLAWAMLAPNAYELIYDKKIKPTRLWAVILAILGAVCILLLYESGPFIYFQF